MDKEGIRYKWIQKGGLAVKVDRASANEQQSRLCVLMRLAAFSTQDRRVMSVGSQSDIIRTPFCPRGSDVINTRQCDQIDVHTNNGHGFNIRQPKGWSLKTYKTLRGTKIYCWWSKKIKVLSLLLMTFWIHPIKYSPRPTMLKYQSSTKWILNNLI